ncbi:MAG: hypothetical protein F6J93_37435 [Oscillatoria sp. SIO1A7]|nr:hypothetical protein [Oscillatoria sp. SIO1A7]
MRYEAATGVASHYGGYRSMTEIVSGMLSPLHSPTLLIYTYLRNAICTLVYYYAIACL